MILELKNINHKLDDFELKNINLSIPKGEYHVLLGPSGAGKSVLLNLIAGFYLNYKGKIFLNSVDITNFSPQKRNVSILFQDLALFPHLNVYNNIAFPLKMRKFSKTKIDAQVQKYINIAEISNLTNRKIQDLSGGEKQRVAIARCLVSGADILLLDEPLTAVDTQLRNSLKDLLRSIHKLGKTIIHVTHDLNETKSLADKISVIHKGRIIETGSYNQVFNNPKNFFTAEFNNAKNCYRLKTSCESFVEIGNTKLYFDENAITNKKYCGVFIAPQDVKISNLNNSKIRNLITAEIISVSKNGMKVEIELDAGFRIFSAMDYKEFIKSALNVGCEVKIEIEPKNIKLINS